MSCIDGREDPVSLIRHLKYATFTYQSGVVYSVLEYIQGSSVEPGNLYIPMFWLIAQLYYGWYITGNIHDIRRQTTLLRWGYQASILGTILISYLF